MKKFTITTEDKGKRTVHTCKDENGNVIATRTSESRVYGFATVCDYDPVQAAANCRRAAAKDRAEAARYRKEQTGEGPEYAKACAQYGKTRIDQWRAAGDFTRWAATHEKNAATNEEAATAWDNGTHENKPHVIGWSSTLKNATQPRAGSALRVLAIATLAQ